MDEWNIYPCSVPIAGETGHQHDTGPEEAEQGEGEQVGDGGGWPAWLEKYI